jgi:hypothetical protein
MGAEFGREQKVVLNGATAEEVMAKLQELAQAPKPSQ